MKIYEHGRLVGLDALDSAAIRIKADGFFLQNRRRAAGEAHMMMCQAV
jgi:hypothetical protein